MIISSPHTIHLLPLIIILVIFPISVQSSDDLINQICKKTPFYRLCSDTLHSAANTSSVDIKGLASNFTNIVLSNATETLSYIHGQLKSGPDDPKTEKALANCAELYIPVVEYNLPQGIDAFNRGYYGFTRYVLSDARNQADACGEKVGGGEVGARNEMVSELSDVAAAIVGLLIKDRGLNV
ncbi:Cell wall / vacuolar inhibitor of fructosidase 1 [Linum perenne]